jgi:O-methyltransferase
VDENPILKTIARMNDGLAGFFWDAFTALWVNDVSGDYVEFGSWGCNTMQHAFHASQQLGGTRHMWAFDSFQGLPDLGEPRDRHPGLSAGGAGQGGVDAFYATCDGFGVPRDAYTAVEGFFQDTLPARGVAGEPRDIALAYIDCNLYSSTVAVFDFLGPRLKPGMIVGFDDFYLWNTDSGTVRGAGGAQRVPRGAPAVALPPLQGHPLVRRRLRRGACGARSSAPTLVSR